MSEEIRARADEPANAVQTPIPADNWPRPCGFPSELSIDADAVSIKQHPTRIKPDTYRSRQDRRLSQDDLLRKWRLRATAHC
jgi:hypothetical protein